MLALCAFPGGALVPEFPAPARIAETSTKGPHSHVLPVGPFANGKIATETFEGKVTATAYQIDSRELTTLEILVPLREQVVAAGYEILFECAAADCGGFDFRFATRVIAEPAMHVDLADFRYLAATRMGPAGREAISLLVSRSALLGFVQLVEVGASLAAPVAPVSAPVTPDGLPSPVAAAAALTPEALEAALRARGAVVLEDVGFASGASVLEPAAIPSLSMLANWLRADPSRVVMLVGHTDASGGLAANVALGAERADAVRRRLVDDLGVPASQLIAKGAGYLAPRASNLTEEGRRLNRRVEVVLVPDG